ncbi:PA1571 family protein [Acinetobacter sp. ANC 5584]
MTNHTQTNKEQRPVKNDCYMVDEHGKEVQITTSMVQDICIKLLEQCRTVKS